MPTKSSVEPGSSLQLATWVSNTTLRDIPSEVLTRAKHLILDGIACGLIGAHLPWSEKAVDALLSIEPPGDAILIGWGNRRVSPLTASLLNSTFIQGFELDDWHSEAPLHSNSLLLPALLAAARHRRNSNDETDHTPAAVTGSDIMLAMAVGYEVGPRVGNALHGSHVLTTGWHSGAVFGPPAVAAAVGKLLGLSPEQIEDAFGIACTQACGLMSAQFGSDAKRMHHGFAARNGLLAAILAQGGYTGIKGVFEQSYGGFLKQFSAGNGKEPPYLVDELTKGLGVKWQTFGVRVKPYAAMAATHPTIDCVRALQESHPDRMKNQFRQIRKIGIELGDASYHHGGWKATRPLTSTGAQMSNAYAAATQIVHGEVLAAQFRHDMLENDDVWRLVDVTDCVLNEDTEAPPWRQTVTIEFDDGTVLSHRRDGARGVNPPLSNEEIVEKWRLLTRGVIDEGRASRMEKLVLTLEECPDISVLLELLAEPTRNPIE
jgi:aconitate decarboxylase